MRDAEGTRDGKCKKLMLRAQKLEPVDDDEEENQKNQPMEEKKK